MKNITSIVISYSFKLINAVPFFLFLSCTDISKPQPGSSLRDSVLRFYKEELSVNPRYDTMEFNYQLLNAYLANDSLSLNALLKELRNERENRKWFGQFDSCIKLTKLRQMDVDEGYRFEYAGAFCDYRQITTIYKRRDSIKLNFQLYKLGGDTSPCKRLEEFDRTLTPNNWKEFLSKLDEGDFWGLKTENNRHGLDGSTWYVTGYKKSYPNLPPMYHFVERWGEITIGEAFRYATLLAGNKKGCLIIYYKKK